MSERGDRGRDYFKNGLNCAQAVLAAFADVTGLDDGTMKKIAAGFGGGMGRLREVCGTVSGAVMAMGLILGDKVDKATLYSYIQEFAQKFKDGNGSIICRELLGLDKGENCAPEPSTRTEQYYKKRPCAELVKYSAELLEDFLKEKGI